ncbi:MAG: radical SAM protein [Desulfobacterium sp.]|nr:radical SAM protein [Desulfobacterium sp.]
MGEYYLPCLPYPSNAVWEINYFANSGVMNAFAAWSQLYADLYGAQGSSGLHSKTKALISQVLQNHDGVLYERSQELNEIIGGRVTVLPPDTRHVDYEVIPIIIADGCLYHCDFCCVKSPHNFHKRSESEITEQIQRLKIYYGRNLQNLNALFLGNHDALAAGSELICFTASEAFNAFYSGNSRAITPFLFLFGSVDSLLNSKNDLFEQLGQLPFYTYINIGFESVDASTLKFIGKPVDASKVRAAFQKMIEISDSHTNIEITGNFLVGEQLSSEHYKSLAGLLRDTPGPSNGKGAIYLSPLKDSPKRRELLPRFYEIKSQSQLPVYIYLIQRL